jgi:autotransporter-associated beta strand protein
LAGPRGRGEGRRQVALPGSEPMGMKRYNFGWPASLAALIAGTSMVPAVIVGPYSPDAHTLHLWHFDEPAPPITNAVAGGLELTVLGGGAVLTNLSYPGFGGSLNTFDGGPNATAGTDRDAYAAPRTLVNGTADNVSLTYADPASGAFTLEALVRIDFDPSLNYGPVASGGNGRAAPMQIVTAEDEANAGRVFQFRIVPIGVINNNPYVYLEFINVHQAAPPIENITVPIPTEGPDAIQQGQWYHVAVTYDGNENTPDNLKFYWTRMDPNRTEANLIGTWAMQNDLPVAATDFVVGNIGRNPSQNNFVGLIDEVRISSIARPANGMMFAPAPPIVVSQPQPQTLAVGQSFTLAAAASGQLPLAYQWERNGQPIPGATQEVLHVDSATLADDGLYRLRVTNVAGVAYSDPVRVQVRTPADLVWAPAVSWTWNSTDPNWDSNGDRQADTTFTGGDRVTFDDTGVHAPVVYLEGVLNPSRITVQTSSEYQFTMLGSAALVNKLTLVKAGPGTLTLDVDGSWSGPTLVAEGTLQIGAGSSRGSLGRGPVTNQATLVFNRTGTLNLPDSIWGPGHLINSNTGTIRLLGTNGLTPEAHVVIDRGAIVFGPAALGSVTNIVARPFGPLLGTQFALTGGAVVGSNVTIHLASTNWSDGISTYDWRSSIFAEAGSNIVHAHLRLSGNSAIFLAAEAGAWLEVDGPVSGPDFTYQFAMRGNGQGLLRSVVTLPQGALAKTDGGVWTVAGDGSASTYLYTLIVGGRLALGNDNALNPNAYLRLGNGVFDLAGFNQTVSGLSNETSGVRLIASSSTNRDSVLTITTDRSWIFDGQIADSTAGGTRTVGLTFRGSANAALTLSATNPYSGPTRIEAGRLILTGAADLPNTASLWIGSNAVLDVSTRTDGAFVLSPRQTLRGEGRFFVVGSLTNLGTIELRIRKAGAALAHDRLAGLQHLQLGGTLRLVLSGDPLAPGDVLPLFEARTLTGAFQTIEPPAPGPGLAWDLENLGVNGSLRVVATELRVPTISRVEFGGAQLVLRGQQGPPEAPYTLLATTNLALPLFQWTPVTTGQFGRDGSFEIVLPVQPEPSQRYFRLRVP